jgi:hypothetical protein
MMAYIQAEKWVKDRLVSPSTAKFPSIKTEHVTRYAGNKYRINSYVDSQNKMGATIRTRWMAEVENYEEDMWRLLSIEIFD